MFAPVARQHADPPVFDGGQGLLLGCAVRLLTAERMLQQTPVGGMLCAANAACLRQFVHSSLCPCAVGASLGCFVVAILYSQGLHSTPRSPLQAGLLWDSAVQGVWLKLGANPAQPLITTCCKSHFTSM